MTKQVPVLAWYQNVNLLRVGFALVDTSLDQRWIIQLAGTDETGTRMKPKFVVIDNTGNKDTVYISYGVFRYSVSPFNRRTFEIAVRQEYIIVEGTVGTVPLYFTEGPPGIPDEINQIATGIIIGVGGGGGSVTGAPWDSTLNTANVAYSNNDLTGTLTGAASYVKTAITKTSGKYYFEAKLDVGSSSNDALGIVMTTYVGGVPGASTTAFGLNFSGGGIFYGGAVVLPMTSIPGANQLLVAIDLTAKKVWHKVLGSSAGWNGVLADDPATGVGGYTYALTGALTIATNLANVGDKVTLNSGSSPFLGSAPSGFTAGWPT